MDIGIRLHILVNRNDDALIGQKSDAFNRHPENVNGLAAGKLGQKAGCIVVEVGSVHSVVDIHGSVRIHFLVFLNRGGDQGKLGVALLVGVDVELEDLIADKLTGSFSACCGTYAQQHDEDEQQRQSFFHVDPSIYFLFSLRENKFHSRLACLCHRSCSTME